MMTCSVVYIMQLLCVVHSRQQMFIADINFGIRYPDNCYTCVTVMYVSVL